MKEYTVKNETEMAQLATDFASTLKGGEVIGLIGDLGAGKTTFVRGVVAALGSDVRVKSPTFTVMNEYPVRHDAVKRVLHLDLYRFQNPVELEALAFEDEHDDAAVTFVEWPDIFEERAFAIHKEIRFEILDDGSRKVCL